MDKSILWRPPQVHQRKYSEFSARVAASNTANLVYHLSSARDQASTHCRHYRCAGQGVNLSIATMSASLCHRVQGTARYSDVLYFTGNSLRYRLRACVMKLGFLDVFSSYIHKHKALPSKSPLALVVCGLFCLLSFLSTSTDVRPHYAVPALRSSRS